MSNHTKGVLCILAMGLGLALMNVFVRLAGELPSMQKMFMRNVIMSIGAFIFVRRTGGIIMPKGTGKHILARCCIGFLAVLGNLYAVDHLNLSDATVLGEMTPFCTILFSFILLKEKPRGYQILLTLFAFLGCVLVAKPGKGSIDLFPVLVQLGAALCAGCAYTECRILGLKGMSNATIVFLFAVFCCLVTVPSMILHFVPMNMWQIFCMLMVGIMATVMQFGVTAAYRFAPASEISAYEYFQIPFSAVLGYVIFNQLGDAWGYAGYVLICGAGILMAMLQRREARSAIM